MFIDFGILVQLRTTIQYNYRCCSAQFLPANYNFPTKNIYIMRFSITTRIVHYKNNNIYVFIFCFLCKFIETWEHTQYTRDFKKKKILRIYGVCRVALWETPMSIIRILYTYYTFQPCSEIYIFFLICRYDQWRTQEEGGRRETYPLLWAFNLFYTLKHDSSGLEHNR